MCTASRTSFFSCAHLPLARVHRPQVFPTSVRTTGVGIVTSCARLGGAAAPALVAAVGTQPAVALVVCGVVAAVCGVLAVKFPLETANCALVDDARVGDPCGTPSPQPGGLGPGPPSTAAAHTPGPGPCQIRGLGAGTAAQ